ncbi:MAG: FAD-dependent oxidoreductase [Chitinophagaceae bacterium]|nr:MAG: FAD-dependent oxidoreductase [Chitinophagaceae bacterium]
MKKFFLLLVSVCSLSGQAQQTLTTDVLVIGGSTGGTAAGIQSARLGVKTIIVESTPWLGGMISAAGVSAVDGNHRLPSGLWAEFRSRLYQRYGGPEAVETGWVSNTLFEPRIADSIFKSMAGAEKDLTVFFNHGFTTVTKRGNRLEGVTFTNKANGKTLTIRAKTFIDATELGDVIKAAGIPYDLGMESGAITGEKVGVHETNDIVQDLTYVAVLKDYGKGANKTIRKPANYNPAEFDAACTDYYIDKTMRAPTVDALKMLEYGKLPNNKYMLNWPLSGNDTYLNVVEMTEAEREKELVKAKETTRRFIYFIQHQLGFKHLGLADDEFPTKDRFALIPYHREGRRVKGLVRFTMRHIAEPFTYGDPLYRTGISVGDYPIDHHHKKNLSAPQHLEFYSIASFNVPLGALIPQAFENLVVAEKGISVSNVVNGTTRLQPCVLLTGQAAGTLAAISAQQAAALQTVPVRSVQQKLLQTGAYLMPYIDVTPDNPFFEAIQKVGATGILKGKGVPYKWANQTWFYPEQPLSQFDLVEGLRPYYTSLENYLEASGEMLTLNALLKIFDVVGVKLSAEKINADWKMGQALEEKGVLNRQTIAWLVDRYLQPFERPVSFKGEVQ